MFHVRSFKIPDKLGFTERLREKGYTETAPSAHVWHYIRWGKRKVLYIDIYWDNHRGYFQAIKI